MTQDDADKLKGTKAKPAKHTELATGVTAKNYGAKGSEFIKLNPDKATVVVRENSSKRDEAGNPYSITEEGLRQWGAWHAYLKRLGYSVKLMEKRPYWTVPAPWPHLFDAEATVADDHFEAVDYLRLRRVQSNAEFDRSNELRRATVLKALGYDPDRKLSKRDFVKPTQADLDGLVLKTPPAPASNELKQLLRDQGYGHLVDRPDAAPQKS